MGRCFDRRAVGFRPALLRRGTNLRRRADQKPAPARRSKLNPQKLRVPVADRHVEHELPIEQDLERADVAFDLLRDGGRTPQALDAPVVVIVAPGRPGRRSASSSPSDVCHPFGGSSIFCRVPRIFPTQSCAIFSNSGTARFRRASLHPQCCFDSLGECQLIALDLDDARSIPCAVPMSTDFLLRARLPSPAGRGAWVDPASRLQPTS